MTPHHLTVNLMFCTFAYISFSESAAARPKLKLLPRSVKDPVNSVVQSERNTSIFGAGKPREESNNDNINL